VKTPKEYKEQGAFSLLLLSSSSSLLLLSPFSPPLSSLLRSPPLSSLFSHFSHLLLLLRDS